MGHSFLLVSTFVPKNESGGSALSVLLVVGITQSLMMTKQLLVGFFVDPGQQHRGDFAQTLLAEAVGSLVWLVLGWAGSLPRSEHIGKQIGYIQEKLVV